MIRYTNEQNLSPLVALWVLRDEYDNTTGATSATTLMKPARATALLRKAELEGTEVVIDISTMIAARYGTAIHDSIEKVLLELLSGESENTYVYNIVKELYGSVPSVQVVEKRYFSEINGVEVSGKIDAVIDGVVNDHKSTSAYSWTKNMDDYITQLSIYRWLLIKNNNYTPHMGKINFWFTDWSAAKALAGKDYPKSRCLSKLVTLLSTVDTEKYIVGRLEAIDKAMAELPECADEELWPNPTVYAHMREGRKTAVKLYGTKKEAEEAVILSGSQKDYMEERPGGYRRCKYCYASSICDQYKRMKEQNQIQE